MQSLFVNSQRKSLLIAIPCVLSFCLLTGIQSSFAEPPSMDEMWEIIQQQQELITELKARLDKMDQRVTVNEEKVEETVENIEATTEAIEATADAVEANFIAATKGHGGSKTSIGGYGELHYNNQEGDDEVDFHRFILYFGHEFTDNIRFFSELELEHALAGEGKSGEIELEQAWIEADITESHRFGGAGCRDTLRHYAL